MKCLQDGSPGHMYQFGHTAKAYKMIVLTELGGEAPNTELLRIAEHTGICPFQSWTPVLLRNFTDAVKHYFDSTITKAYSALATSTFARTGWKVQPGLQGLNWRTPLSELLLSHTSFICQTVPGGEASSPIRVYKSGPRAITAYPCASKKKQDGPSHTLFSFPEEWMAVVEFASVSTLMLMMKYHRG
jgi:hypothetical protein